MKRKAYTVSTKLQVLEVTAKTSKEAAVKKFSVVPCRILSGSVMLKASDNFCVARIVRLLQTTMLSTALYNKKASQVTTAEKGDF